LKSANPGLLKKLQGSGKLEAHLASVRQRATRLHKQLEHGWKRLNPYSTRVHRSQTDHEKLAAREVEQMVLDAILPRGKKD